MSLPTRRLALAAAMAVLSCSSSTDPPVTAPLADAASIRLFRVETHADWTSHIPLVVGYTAPIRVRLYLADGREIVNHPNPIHMTFTFSPAPLASGATADTVLMVENVTPTDTAGAGGTLSVSLTEPATSTQKTFGPFSVLIHESNP